MHLFPILIIIQYSGRKSKESTSAILHAHLGILLGVPDPSRHFRRCQWHSAAVLWICLFRLKNWEVNSSLSFMIWSFLGSLCFAFFFFFNFLQPFLIAVSIANSKTKFDLLEFVAEYLQSRFSCKQTCNSSHNTVVEGRNLTPF